MAKVNWYDKKLTAEDRKNEKWADLPEFNGKYSISSLGRIMSDHGAGYRNITPQINNYGQVQVQLISTNSARKDDMKNIMLGRAVAELFVPNPNNYDHIRFKNGDPLDCRAENIEWIKHTDKMKEQYSAMLKKVNKYDLDGNYIQTYASIGEAAEKTDSHASCIGKACRTHKPHKNALWRYESDVPQGESIEKYEPPKKQGILQLDKNTLEVIREYEDLNDVYETFKIEKGKPDRGNIFNVCKGKRNSAYGYKWAFADNSEE